MKKTLILVLFPALFLFAGCDIKTAAPTLSPINDINQAQEVPVHLIPADQIAQMEALMNKNGKSLIGLQAYRLEKDQIGMTHIRFNFYVNGILADETIYHFDADGTLSSITNEPDANLYSNISTIPKISKSQAILIAGDKIKKITLDATKEFWDKNGSSSGAKDIVLAWRVQEGDEYPLVIIDAQTGEILYYDDGIRY